MADIPSEMMRLTFSQFKNVILNQGLIIRDADKIDRKVKVNFTQQHFTPIIGFQILNKDSILEQNKNSYALKKEDFKSPHQARILLSIN